MGPMLKEEAFHMGTGNNGLLRIGKARKIPVPLLQKYFYKWVPTGYDLFGAEDGGLWGRVFGTAIGAIAGYYVGGRLLVRR